MATPQDLRPIVSAIGKSRFPLRATVNDPSTAAMVANDSLLLSPLAFDLSTLLDKYTGVITNITVVESITSASGFTLKKSAFKIFLFGASTSLPVIAAGSAIVIDKTILQANDYIDAVDILAADYSNTTLYSATASIAVNIPYYAGANKTIYAVCVFTDATGVTYSSGQVIDITLWVERD